MWLAIAAGAVATVLAPVALMLLYPTWFVAPVALIATLTLGAITREVVRASSEGFVLEAALLIIATLPVVGWYRPFGIVLPGVILAVWTSPRVRAYFGLGQVWGPARPPAVVVGALLLAGAELWWLATLPGRPFLGYNLGVLAFTNATTLTVFALLALTGTALRSRGVDLWVPFLLTPALVAVYPLGWFLPLLCFWASPQVGDWFRRRRSGWISAVAPLIGLAAFSGLMPVGRCDRDGFGLRLIRECASPLFPAGLIERDDEGRKMEPMKVACPLHEYFVALRPLRDECRRRRLRWTSADIPNAVCPFDAALRAKLGADAIPPNRFEPTRASSVGKGAMGILPSAVPAFSCRTCSMFARGGGKTP